MRSINLLIPSLGLLAAGCDVLPTCGDTPPPPTARFDASLCTLPDPALRDGLLAGEAFGPVNAAASPMRLDEHDLYLQGPDGQLSQYDLATGQPDGAYDLGVARSRRFLSIVDRLAFDQVERAGANPRWTYVWSTSNVETTSERKQELIAVDFLTQQERTVFSAPLDPPSRIPQLADSNSITWLVYRDDSFHDLIRTDKQGGNEATLASRRHLGPPVQDTNFLYWIEFDGPDPAQPTAARLVRQFKSGGSPFVLVDGLPPTVQPRLGLQGDRIVMSVLDPTGGRCDRTIFAIQTQGGRLLAIARAPVSGTLSVHGRGLLWQEAGNRIFHVDSSGSRVLVRGSDRPVDLLGVQGDHLYWHIDNQTYRAPLP